MSLIKQVVKQVVKPEHLLVVTAGVFFFILGLVPIPNLGGNMTPRSLFGWICVWLSIGVLFSKTPKRGAVYYDVAQLLAIGLPFVAVCISLLATNPSPLVFAALYALIPATVGLFLLGIAQYRLPIRAAHSLLAVIAVGLFIHLQGSMWRAPMFELPPLHQLIPSILHNQFAGFYQENNFASFAATLTLWLGFAYAQNRHLPRALGFLFLFFTFIFSASISVAITRVGLLGLLLGWVCMGGYYARFGRANALRRYGVIAAVSIMGVLIGYEWCRSVLGNISGYTYDETLFGRAAMLVVSWDLFLHAPFFGYGIGNFGAEYAAHYAALNYGQTTPITDNTNDPHNLIMLLLVEMGLVGTLLILTPIGFILGRWVLASPVNWPIAIALLPIALHIMVEFPYKASGVHYWLAGIVALSLYRRRVAIKRFKISPQLRTPTAIANAVAVAVAVGVCTQTAYLSHMAYMRGNALNARPLTEIIGGGIAQPELAHPFLRRDLTRHTYYYLSLRAVAEGDLDLISGYLRPLYRALVLPYVQGRRGWHLALVMDMLLDDTESAQAQLAYVRRLNPAYADELTVFYEKFRRDDPRPPPMRAHAMRLKARGYPPLVF